MSIVGRQIAKARAAKEMNQSEFALALGFKNKQTVSNWENGVSEPDTLTLVKISEVCGVTVDWLLKGDSPASNNVQNVENMNFSSGTGSVTHRGPTNINSSSPDHKGYNIQDDLISTIVKLNQKIFDLEAEIKVLKGENQRLKKTN
ncbi:MAG TPA: helix-turn-helix domain-containing protein [Ignavibacteriales bacterium]|nr:helix-turn-helix domain-containing protein [Ignavibacteriales bacterium]